MTLNVHSPVNKYMLFKQNSLSLHFLLPSRRLPADQQLTTHWLTQEPPLLSQNSPPTRDIDLLRTTCQFSEYRLASAAAAAELKRLLVRQPYSSSARRDKLPWRLYFWLLCAIPVEWHSQYLRILTNIQGAKRALCSSDENQFSVSVYRAISLIYWSCDVRII